MPPRVFLVTGGNQGIGLACVRQLALRVDKPATIFLTARKVENGENALADLEKELKGRKVLKSEGGNVELKFHQLDVLDDKSVEKLAEHLRSFPELSFGGLLNNAGMAFKGDAFDETVARETLATNYYGVLRVTRALAPLLSKTDGRVVTISSTAGRLQSFGKKLQEKIKDPSLTVEQLSSLMEKFVSDVAQGCYAAEGFPKTGGLRQFRVNLPYGVSKVGATALTKVLAREPTDGNIKYVACCPGWVRTNMAGPRAPLSPDEGADTPVHLMLAPIDELVNGGFYSKRKLTDSSVGF